ncbi:hypothetical protein WI664_16070 [Vibrio cholerae]
MKNIGSDAFVLMFRQKTGARQQVNVWRMQACFETAAAMVDMFGNNAVIIERLRGNKRAVGGGEQQQPGGNAGNGKRLRRWWSNASCGDRWNYTVFRNDGARVGCCCAGVWYGAFLDLPQAVPGDG